MPSKKIKKILSISLLVVVLLAITLSVHIYVVTRPKAPTAKTLIMARMDVDSSISTKDSADVVSWFYQQEGIDHVLCNPATSIIVFTFHPLQTKADIVINHFNSAFNLKGKRFLPSKEEMSSGCPVASSSFTYKLYESVKRIL